ncbi:MAG: hypothetical protein WBE20_00680 [Candidatus Acidiferrales bacterium]
MSEANAAIAVYPNHAAAEEAIMEIRGFGFDSTKLSAIDKERRTEDSVAAYHATDDRIKHWGKVGAIAGGFLGLVLGVLFFAIPESGPVLVVALSYLGSSGPWKALLWFVE